MLRYYELSHFNTQEASAMLENRLDQQPLIQSIVTTIPSIIHNISKSRKLLIQHLHLIDVLNVCLSLNSAKVYEAIRTAKYFNVMIDLLFNNGSLNIVQKAVERGF